MQGDRYDYDAKKQQYVKTINFTFDKKERQPYTSIVAGEYLFYKWICAIEPFLVRSPVIMVQWEKMNMLSLPAEVIREQGI